MSRPALLLGDPGRAPFAGHARARVVGPRATMTAAGRVAAGAGLVVAYGAARALEEVLHRAAGPGDRNAMLRRAWEALEALPAAALGPEGGADLSLLLVAEDAEGIGVAAVGLAALWGELGGQLLPLVEGKHPLLCPPGRPSRTPGVLTLDLAPERLVGCPASLDPTPPALAALDARCGVHR